MGKGGQGEIKLITPTKRKLLQQKPVSKLARVFDNYREISDILPGESGQLESPAKRSKSECEVNNLSAN